MRVSDGALVVEAVAVEFGDPGCGDHDAGWMAVLDNVEGEKERVAEGGCDAIVRRRGPCQQVDLGGVDGAGYIAGGGNGKGEEWRKGSHD